MSDTANIWLAEATELFGPHDAWKFRCPSCGTVSSVADFTALGVDGQRAPFECIGRVHKEQGATHHIDGDTKPCNWAANGLIRLGNLTEVMYRGGAKTTFVFPFADVVQAVDAHVRLRLAYDALSEEFRRPLLRPLRLRRRRERGSPPRSRRVDRASQGTPRPCSSAARRIAVTLLLMLVAALVTSREALRSRGDLEGFGPRSSRCRAWGCDLLPICY